MLKSPRGASDILPPESLKWIYLEGVVERWPGGTTSRR